MQHGFTIREEHGFRQQAVALFGSDRVADWALGGVSCALSRNVYGGNYPCVARSLRTGELYAIRSCETAAYKPFTVIFSLEWNEKKETTTVCLWSIEWSGP